MADYKQLLADFDRWTGKGNLIQANQTAAKLFRLIFEGEARDGKQMLTEATVTDGTIAALPRFLTRGDRQHIANEIQWERAAINPYPPVEIPVDLPPEFEEPMSPAEAIATAVVSPTRKAPPKDAVKKAAAKKAPAKKGE